MSLPSFYFFGPKSDHTTRLSSKPSIPAKPDSMQAVRAAVKPINLLCSGPAEADEDYDNHDDDDFIIIRSMIMMTILTIGTVPRASRG